MVNGRESLAGGLFPASDLSPVEWAVSARPIAYPDALAAMDARAAAIAAGTAPELVWLLEHPPLYTAGTSAQSGDVIDARFPLFASGRGGQLTYHGPGQRVAYAMIDLERRVPDVRRYVATLEEWIIRTLATFDVMGERRQDRVGVWVQRPDKGDGHEDKIAAIGIRIRHWVSLHGIALNVAPDLTHFAGIVPCGVAEPRFGVTSLADLGRDVTMDEVDAALRREFAGLFGATIDAPDALPGIGEARIEPARGRGRPI
ncbi:MAG TPA: lipoyl(octanoyl) transferase LipB [Xanthobacteraceae bacterium]|nr:lipoyl(octanoyl) transferase LipB [Xanthobacteraceae bacterium]